MEFYRSNVKYNFLRKLLIQSHKSSHLNRVSILSNEYAKIIKEKIPARDTIRCLDVGCGDMKIAKKLNSLISQTQWDCIDTFEMSNDIINSKLNYISFDGQNIPPNKIDYDFILFSDVLHHVDGNKYHLMEQAASRTKFLIIKDHFESGMISRKILQLMDIYGNWGQNVNIPANYFTQESFKLLCSKLSVENVEIKIGIDLYSNNSILKNLLSKSMQFIAVLTV